MGFDILYLPPIHPIGDTYRKGKNNSLNPTDTDVGSHGPSVLPRAGTRRFTLNWARSRIFIS